MSVAESRKIPSSSTGMAADELRKNLDRLILLALTLKLIQVDEHIRLQTIKTLKEDNEKLAQAYVAFAQKHIIRRGEFELIPNAQLDAYEALLIRLQNNLTCLQKDVGDFLKRHPSSEARATKENCKIRIDYLLENLNARLSFLFTQRNILQKTPEIVNKKELYFERTKYGFVHNFSLPDDAGLFQDGYPLVE